MKTLISGQRRFCSGPAHPAASPTVPAGPQAAPQQPSGSKDAPAGSIKSNAADPTASIGSPKIAIPFFRMCLSSLLLLPGLKAIQKRSPAIFPRILSRLPGL